MIYRKKLFTEILVLSIIIALIHYFASVHALYWSIDWLDILMHFLGGLLMGWIGLFIFFTSEKIHLPRNNTLLICSIALGFVLIVGLLWELWEVFIGFSDVIHDRGDTILDIIMDMIGALVAYRFSIRHIWTQN